MLTKDQQLALDASNGLRIVHPTALEQRFLDYCAKHPDMRDDDYSDWIGSQLEEGALIEKRLNCYTTEYYDVI